MASQDNKFRVTANHRKVRVVWDRKPYTKVKESKKKYNRKDRKSYNR